MLAGGEHGSHRPAVVGGHFLPVRRGAAFFVEVVRLEPPPDLPLDFPDLADLAAPAAGGFFPLALLVLSFVVFALLPCRCRRAASTRFPTPRPSLASWVGVDVDPEICFSGVLVSEVESEPDSVLVSESDAVDEVLLEFSPELESPSPEAEERSSPEAEDLPPTRIAAPMPISRRSFRFRHSGQLRLGFAVID